MAVVVGLMANLVAVASVIASETSEVLTAKGELAYAQGRSDEAVGLLERAVIADPQDPLAQNALGQVLLALGRRDAASAAFNRALEIDPTLQSARLGLARATGTLAPSAAGEHHNWTVGEISRLPSVRSEWDAKRWGFSVTTGFQYDSNVKVLPGGEAAAGLGDTNDVGWVAAFSAQYNLIERSNFLLRAEYDLYQTLHLDISDFDFRSQQPRLTASYAITPDLWVGTQGGYNYYSLGNSTYEGEPYVLPFVSYLEGTWGLTQVFYRWGEATYMSSPFTGVRSGPDQTVDASQTFFLGGDRYATVGFNWTNENPDATFCDQDPPAKCRAFGNDWQYSSYQGYLGLGSPIPLGAYVDFLYLFRSDDYKWPNSYADFRKSRQDYGNHLYIAITRPITEHISAAVTYYGTFNPSNIPDFQYTRNVVSTLLQVTY